MTLVQGQVLQNRYRVVKLLGQGGFGAVYRAWDLNLSKPVAIKENLDTSPEAQKQFQNEALILSSLSHPNLPRVTDHFLIPGAGQYLVMDFVEGDDLQTILSAAGRPLPEAQVLSWIDQVCDALAYLHSNNPPIIHRDIKPANIKITPQGKAVLVDFGISKIYDPVLKTTVGARAVAPGYSPPEQYGHGATDQRSDIYALGATLYALLTGQEPPESVARVATGAPLTPPRQIAPMISPAVEAAVLRACEPAATQRLQSVNEFRQALRLQATPIVPPPVTLPAPIAPTTQRRSRAPIGLAIGGLAVISLIIIVLLASAPHAAAPLLPSSPSAVPTIEPADTAAPTAAATPLPSPTLKPSPTSKPFTSTPQPTSIPTALPAGMLFTDDFTSLQVSKAKGWSAADDESTKYSWTSDTLLISVNKANTIGWNSPTGLFVDFGAEIEAQPHGTGYAEYGIVFRSEDSDNFYYFGITTSGKYFLWKQIDGKWVKPALVDATTSSRINRGSAQNRLGVLADGSQISLYINGVLVKTVSDESLFRGKVRVFAGTGDDPPAEVAFSQLTIWAVDTARAEWGGPAAPSNASTQPTPRPQPVQATPAPPRPANSSITVRNSFAQTCRIVLWGPADITIDAGNGQSVTRIVNPGTYGWRAFVGGAETGQADNLVVGRGAQCSFFCDGAQRLIRWGCN